MALVSSLWRAGISLANLEHPPRSGHCWPYGVVGTHPGAATRASVVVFPFYRGGRGLREGHSQSPRAGIQVAGSRQSWDSDQMWVHAAVGSQPVLTPPGSCAPPLWAETETMRSPAAGWLRGWTGAKVPRRVGRTAGSIPGVQVLPALAHPLTGLSPLSQCPPPA